MHEALQQAYFISTASVAVFVLVVYFLRISLWPTPSNPRRIILFNVLGNGWLLANLAMAVYLSIASPIPLIFTSPAWSAVAAILAVAGLAISLWAFTTFRTMRRIFGMEIPRLVTEGPYKYMRHPQYFSILLWTLAATILFNTLQMLVYAVSTSLAFYMAGFMEERKLEELFGEQYRRYRERTPVIPFMSFRRKRSLD